MNLLIDNALSPSLSRLLQDYGQVAEANHGHTNKRSPPFGTRTFQRAQRKAVMIRINRRAQSLK